MQDYPEMLSPSSARISIGVTFKQRTSETAEAFVRPLQRRFSGKTASSSKFSPKSVETRPANC